MPVLAKDAFEFAVLEEGLRLRITEYHCGSAHLTREELGALGLEASRPAEELPASEVLRRWAAQSVAPDREPIGPAITDPDFVSPAGHQAGDFRLVLVREGLDVYVDDYDPCEALVPSASLRQLGLVRRRRAPASPAGSEGALSPEVLRGLHLCSGHAEELLAAFDAAAGARPEGAPAPVVILAAPTAKVEAPPFERFHGRFSLRDSRHLAEAVHDDAAALGRVHLFFTDHRLSRYFHFHLLRAEADGCSPARAVPPTAWGLSLEEFEDAQARRREYVQRHATLVRLLPPGEPCHDCQRPLQRRSYHLFNPEEDVLELEGCAACGREAGSCRARLVDLSPAQLARFLPAGQVARLSDAAARARPGPRTG